MEECWTGHKNLHFLLKGGICFMTIQMKWLHSVSEWIITGKGHVRWRSNLKRCIILLLWVNIYYCYNSQDFMSITSGLCLHIVKVRLEFKLSILFCWVQMTITWWMQKGPLLLSVPQCNFRSYDVNIGP